MESAKNTAPEIAISRRKVLKRIGIGVGVVAGAAIVRQGLLYILPTEEGSTDPKDFPQEFSDWKNMPGLQEARILRFGNAQRYMVFIRQRHRILEMTPEHEEKIKECQDEIYQLLSHFMDHPLLQMKEVFAEGITPETEDYEQRGSRAPAFQRSLS